MFKQLREQEKASRLIEVAGEYEEGIKLYKSFSEALKAQDKVRAPRLGVKVDSYYSSLTQPQKYQFCAILVKSGLITGILAKAIATFDAALVEMPEEVTF